MSETPASLPPQSDAERTEVRARTALFYPAVFLAVFLLAAAAALPFLLHLANYKERVLEAVRGAVARPVWIGTARLDFSQGVGFALGDVAIRDPAAGRDLLRAERIVVALNPAELVRGRLELTELALVGPKVFLRRDDGGAWSVEGLFTPEFLARLPKAEPAPLERRIADLASGPLSKVELRVERGSVELVDSFGPWSGALEDLDFSLSRQLLLRRQELELSVRPRLGRDALGAATISAKIPFPENEGDAPTLEFEADLSDAPAAPLVARAGLSDASAEGLAKLAVKGSLAGGRALRFDARLRVEKPEFVAPAIYQGPLSASALTVETAGSYDSGDLDLPTLKVQADGAAVAGSARLGDLDTDDPMLRFAATTPWISTVLAARYIPAPFIDRPEWDFLTRNIAAGEGRVLSSLLEGRLSQFADIGAPGNAGIVACRFEFRGGRLDMPKGVHPLAELQGKLDWEKGTLTFRDWTGAFGPNRIARGEGALIDIFAEISRLEARAAGAARFADAVEQLSLEYAPKSVREAVRRIQSPQGQAEVEIRLRADKWTVEDFPLEISGGARFKGMAMKVRDYAWPLEDVSGDLAFDARSLRTTGLSARVGGDAAAVKGEIRGFLDEKPTFDLDAASPSVDAAKVAPLLPAEWGLRASGYASGNVHVVFGGGAAPDYRGNLELRDVRVTAPEAFADVGPIAGAVHFVGEKVTLRGVQTTYLGHPLTIAADVTSFSPLKGSVNVDAPFVDLKRLVDRFWPKEEGEPPPPQDPRRHDGVELVGALHGGRIEMGEVAFRDFDSAFVVERGDLRIEEFEFESLEGGFRGKGLFERFFDPEARTLSLETKIQGLDVTELSKALAVENDAVTGKVDAATRFRGKAKSWASFRDSLDGGVSFHMSGGAIKGFPILSRVLDVLALNIAGLATGAMEYDAIDGDFAFRSGTGTTRNFLVDSKTMKIRAAGDVILPEKRVDLLLEVQPLSRIDTALGRIPFVGGYLTGSDASRGLVAVYFTAKGPLDDPEVKTVSVDSLLVSPWRSATNWMFQLLGPKK